MERQELEAIVEQVVRKVLEEKIARKPDFTKETDPSGILHIETAKKRWTEECLKYAINLCQNLKR